MDLTVVPLGDCPCFVGAEKPPLTPCPSFFAFSARAIGLIYLIQAHQPLQKLLVLK